MVAQYEVNAPSAQSDTLSVLSQSPSLAAAKSGTGMPNTQSANCLNESQLHLPLPPCGELTGAMK